jgi:quercetin dioxygenase-like cupin family protein
MGIDVTECVRGTDRGAKIGDARVGLVARPIELAIDQMLRAPPQRVEGRCCCEGGGGDSNRRRQLKLRRRACGDRSAPRTCFTPSGSGRSERTTHPAPTTGASVTPRDASPPATPIPADDLSRELTVARPDSSSGLQHFGVVGDTYTILVAGADTDGKYTLIDMHVPPNGGPPPHRHDFEEMFTVLDGEVEATFRGETMTVRAGETINVPANSPHSFRNLSDSPSRLLCMCAPAGQDEFFALVGQPVATRTEAPPSLDAAAQAAFIAKAQSLAPHFRTELLPPPAGPGSHAGAA